MNMSPAVPGKGQVKGGRKSLASLAGTGAFAVAAVLYVMLSGCSKPDSDVKSLAVGPMAKLAKNYADKGVKVVTVSVDSVGEAQKAKDFLKANGDLPFYTDPEMHVVFGLTPRPDGIPVTVIFDKAGQEQARLAGGADWSTDQAKKVMDAVLAKG